MRDGSSKRSSQRRSGDRASGQPATGAGGGPEKGKVRLQRYLADAGVAARRACEILIEEGRVEVNGELVTTLPAFVDPENDRVNVDGRPVKTPGRRVYIALHKPTRTLTTAADEPGFDRRTVVGLVDHPAQARLFPVGRLHYDATGLILLTNDGEFANLLTHPRYGVPKTYWAVVKGIIDPEQVGDIDLKLQALDRKAARAAMGLSTGPKDRRDRDDDGRRQPARGKKAPLAEFESDEDEGDFDDDAPINPDAMERPRFEREHIAKSTRPIVTVVKSGEGKTLLEISMLEARNRQLEDVLQGIGAPVKKITRVAIGPLRLKGLGAGQWRELTGAEVSLLRKIARRGGQMGPGAGTRAGGAPTASIAPSTAKADATEALSDGSDGAAGERIGPGSIQYPVIGDRPMSRSERKLYRERQARMRDRASGVAAWRPSKKDAGENGGAQDPEGRNSRESRFLQSKPREGAPRGGRPASGKPRQWNAGPGGPMKKGGDRPSGDGRAFGGKGSKGARGLGGFGGPKRAGRDGPRGGQGGQDRSGGSGRGPRGKPGGGSR